MHKHEIARSELRKFSFILAGFLLLLGVLQYYWRNHETAGVVLGALGLAAGLTGVAVPAAIRPVYRLFVKLGEWLGWFNTRLILLLIFTFIFTPVALVMRLMRRDALNLRPDRGAGTFWVPRGDEGRGVERYEKMY